MENTNKYNLRIRSLPGDRQGTFGATAGCDSMRTGGDGIVTRRLPIGLPERFTADQLTNLTDNIQNDTLVDASLPQTVGTKAGVNTRRRMKWTDELNQFILRTYLEVTKLEKDLTAYRQKLHGAFIREFPHLAHVTQQRLADQRRVICSNILIPLSIQQRIRQEVQMRLTPADILVNVASNAVHTVSDISQNLCTKDKKRDPIKDTTVQGYTSEITEKGQGSSFNMRISHEFHKAMTEFAGMDPAQRYYIPCQKVTTTLKQIVRFLDTDVMPRYIGQDISLEEMHNIVYCGAVAAVRSNGSRVVLRLHSAKQNINIPAWEKRLMARIENIRRDLGRITHYIQGVRTAKLVRHVNKILEKEKTHGKYDESNKEICEFRDTLTQKLSIYVSRLKRYKRTADRKRQNMQFDSNQKLFYRLLNQENVKTKTASPTPEALYDYWSQLWSNDVKHNVEATWIEKEITHTENIMPMKFMEITETDVTSAVKYLHNWKSPGIDGIHNFWLKYFTCLHKYIAKHFTYLLYHPNETPQFLMKGVTYMLPKDNDTENPTKYRPITCLPTLYKLLTSCITNKIYLHCTDNNILAEEQKGCRKFSRGCKEQLLIDSVILGQTKHRNTNIHIAYIDYKKAFDSVPHSWLQQVLTIYKVHPTIVQFLTYAMSCWNTTLVLKHNDKHVTTQPVPIRRGIFQGDSLSPLWFCLALNPLSHMLNETKYGYSIRYNKLTQHKISHLFYMDDLKLYASRQNQLKQLLHITEIFSEDILMEFGTDKCKTLHIVAGVRERVGFDLQKGGFIRPMEEGETYRYLGLQQEQGIKHSEIKRSLTQQYCNRINTILKTQLDGKNTTKAINTYAVPLLTYSFGVINWTLTDIKNLQIKTRVMLSKHRVHHPHSSSIRVNLPRSEGGRGLVDLELLHERQIYHLREYFQDKSQVSQLHRAIVLADESYTPLNMSNRVIEPLVEKHIQIKNNIQQWSQMPLHGRFPHEVEDASVDHGATYAWLTKCNIFPESEGFMLAIQDQVIYTRNYRKYILGDNKIVSDLCRHCGQGSETIQHITAACTSLAQTDYKHRHDQVARIIHQKLAVKYHLVADKIPYYKYTPPIIVENNAHKLYWDRTLLTDKTVHNNRPDITLIDKVDKITYLVDIAVPNTHNLQKTQAEKYRKYAQLGIELKAQWGMERVITVPVVLSSTGVIPKAIHNSIKLLDLQKSTYVELQKAVIINTCHIVRKFLSMEASQLDCST